MHEFMARPIRRSKLRFRFLTLALAISLAWIGSEAATRLPKSSQADSSAPSSLQRGALLFTGRIPFQNGGPACSVCHSIAGLPFPNGGTLGPNLTHEYARLGPEGMDAALETLYFPAMVSLYDPHPLTTAEQADLKAFFKDSASEPPSPNITPLVAVIALAGFVVLVIITWALWRDRLRSVRRKLVENAMKRGVASL